MKLTVIADTHYYCKSLGASGRAYELRSGSDQKCLAESEEILRAAFAQIAESDTDAVLIAGDLTNNGERASHEGFRCLLEKLRESKPVYVVTATHDWCSDQNPRRYEGDQVLHDVPVMRHDELRDFYAGFGPGQAIAEFTTHLGTSSYVAALSGSVWLLALNDDQNGKGCAGYTPEHLAWILDQLRQAKERGVTVIGLQHHPVLPHVSPLFTGGSCVGDREEIAQTLADAGLRWLFVGHIHMQNILRYDSPTGNTLHEISVGAMCGYPAPMVRVAVEEAGLTLKTERLQRFTYEGETLGQEFLRDHATQLFTRVLDSVVANDKAEFTRRVAALNANGEKIARKFWVIRPAARYLCRLRVRRAAKLLWWLSLGRACKRREIKQFPDMLVLDMAKEVFCGVFCGSLRHARESGYYRAVMAAVSLPYIYKKTRVTRQLAEAIDGILTGGDIDNNDAVLR